MICSGCGSTLPDTANFCINCGSKMLLSDAKTKAMLDVSTKIYSAKELGMTALFRPQEEIAPIFGLLVILEGKDAWKVFNIPEREDPVYMGKGESCRIRLIDESLEEKHASFRIRDGKIFVTDLDTSKGLLLNGRSVAKEELHDGDEIKAGDTVIKYKRL